MSEVINNFLAPSINQIRRSIRGIDDSYNNFWDVLAELIQNSVDAIRKSENAACGEIVLHIDCQKGEISIKDNGCGMVTPK